MSEEEISYLLRVEAVNLGSFITDNDDLSTIRGAGLQVLLVHRLLAGLGIPGVDVQPGIFAAAGESNVAASESAFQGFEFRATDVSEPAEPPKPVRLTLVSSGASIAIYAFRAAQAAAEKLKTQVAEWLRSLHEELRYATFAVQLTPFDDSFDVTRERSAVLARLAQMRYPNVVLGELRQDPVPRFCQIDGRRSASKEEGDKARAVASDKKYLSRATVHRRAFGQKAKVRVYQMINERTAAFEPCWDFGELSCRDEMLDERFHYLAGKMAVIYIDGNKFSSLIRKTATDLETYSQLDQGMQLNRAGLVDALVDRATGKPEWKVKLNTTTKVRIETLMWGGDELIWVVPAWCGLETVQFFFEHSADWKIKNKQLTHAVGLVLCSHKAPIRSVVELAKLLAESVKYQLSKDNQAANDRTGQEGGSELSEIHHTPAGNALAYEVLESFDHLGRDFAEARRDRRFRSMSDSDAILTAEGLNQLLEHLDLLKGGSDSLRPLPRRRVHQIGQVLRRSPFPMDVSEKSLAASQYGKLIRRITTTNASGPQQQAHLHALLNEPLHWQTAASLPAKWHHLIELWDYWSFNRPENQEMQ